MMIIYIYLTITDFLFIDLFILFLYIFLSLFRSLWRGSTMLSTSPKLNSFLSIWVSFLLWIHLILINLTLLSYTKQVCFRPPPSLSPSPSLPLPLSSSPSILHYIGSSTPLMTTAGTPTSTRVKISTTITSFPIGRVSFLSHFSLLLLFIIFCILYLIFIYLYFNVFYFWIEGRYSNREPSTCLPGRVGNVLHRPKLREFAERVDGVPHFFYKRQRSRLVLLVCLRRMRREERIEERKE